MDLLDPAREQQWKVWESMTPAQRLRLMGRMTAQAIGCREVRLRELYHEADEARLRELRIAVTLASSPSLRWSSFDEEPPRSSSLPREGTDEIL